MLILHTFERWSDETPLIDDAVAAITSSMSITPTLAASIMSSHSWFICSSDILSSLMSSDELLPSEVLELHSLVLLLFSMVRLLNISPYGSTYHNGISS